MTLSKLPCRAYHGTTLDRARLILTEGARPNDRDWEWLGFGFYLFQDAPYRAAEWAQFKAGETSTPAVIAATVDLGDCLDLLDVDVWEYVLQFFENFEEQLRSTGLTQEGIILKEGELVASGYHPLDCRFMNSLIKYLGEDKGMTINSIRAAFLEGRAIFPESHLYDKAHVQIAVLDPNVVLSDCSIISV